MEILLRTQTTTRQRYDEIKKLDRGNAGNNNVSLLSGVERIL